MNTHFVSYRIARVRKSPLLLNNNVNISTELYIFFQLFHEALLLKLVLVWADEKKLGIGILY